MPDIKIVCEQCGSDRFVAAANTPLADIVHSIVCAQCQHPVRVDDVVIFREGVYISGTFDAFPSAGPGRLHDFDI
ncbi:hypothetical protein [Rahnella victoriana]|jgi:hypothetical protein|uniref:Uncharacterized protein n=1 Tax=Rahnella victoriana TaxID=1510570 RepID=A0ABS0DUL0_9GAMM|nr:hypothetical protein [Rahnella victoriana]MBF7957573.1 hypothetical protein [Rahnella victoriana]PBI78030.1 hypothetical protein A9993_24665 [Rahnella victoriana]VTQ52642.1 Uncharacterised protein [Campylobacter jejuni]